MHSEAMTRHQDVSQVTAVCLLESVWRVRLDNNVDNRDNQLKNNGRHKELV